MGQPMGGYPEDLQKIVLKGKKPITCRPGELLPDENFDAIKEMLRETHGLEGTDQEALSYALYPKVFEDYLKHIKEHGDFSKMGSDIYFHGLAEGETCEVEVAEGKILVIKLVEIGKISEEGHRRVIFEVNGNRREIEVADTVQGMKFDRVSTIYADESNPLEIGTSIPGTLAKILVSVGDAVKANDTVAIVEAMKMETNITASTSGVIKSIHATEGMMVESGELIIELE